MKKFTEEEYQKIVDIADKYFEQHKELAVTVNLKNIYAYISYNQTVEGEKITNLNQELALIALPKSRDWAHDQFVEKEKKYLWKYKKTDEDGNAWHLEKDSGLIVLGFPSKTFDLFTKTEIIEAGYNPNMFYKEEVE